MAVAKAAPVPDIKPNYHHFSPEDVTVIYILGGPGSGKGTQSSLLVRDFGFTHLSAGDLLRAEQKRPGSEYGEMIADNIKNGVIVDMRVTVKLLSNAMLDKLSETDGKGRFLIDGFPRKLDQADEFEQEVCESKVTLFLDCPEDVMRSRLLNRGKTSGRSDDNEESIIKRFRVFTNESYPVVQHFEEEGRVIRVSAVGTEQEIYANIRKDLEDRGIHPTQE